MTSQTTGLVFTERKIEGWTVPTIEFSRPSRPYLRVAVNGVIINSIVDGARGRERQQNWKAQVASKVKAEREPYLWSSDHRYAISIGFIFHPDNHGRQVNCRGQAKLDVENFVKPVVDAIAAGLFCPDSTEPQNIERWGYDDSNFNTLLIHRLPDARTRAGEGIAISVSARAAR